MKNTFFLLIIGLLFTTSLTAQKKKITVAKQLSVPENVSASFKNLYTTAADNKWMKNYSGNYVANFTNADSLKQTVEFSSSGAMIKSKTMYQANALPQSIGEAITAQYPGTKITEATRLQMLGVAPYYKVKVSSTDNTIKELLVSEDGTITE